MATAMDWLLPAHGRITEANHVEILVDGATYFDRLQSKLSSMSTRTDELFISGWRITGEQRLRPANPSSSIGEWCRTLVANRMKVRAMIYGSGVQTALGTLRIQVPAFPSADNANFVDSLNQAGGEAFLDGRLAKFGSQHQKFVIVRGQESDCAFVGGIDITLDRFDNASHNSPAGRQTEPPVTITVPAPQWNDPFGWTTKTLQDVSMAGWHDAQVLVEGHAVEQVWGCFRDRWNDANPPGFFSRPNPIPGPFIARLGRQGTHHVQVLQTLPCGPFAHAPAGERGITDVCLHAITTAKKFIYIEDQYFWTSPVTRALADAARRGVEIVVLFSRDFDVPLLGYVHGLMRAEALSTIASADPRKLHAFYLERPTARKEQIYVHSKLMIFDDLFALVGSANLNHRSHTNDAELQLGIFDNDIRVVSIGGVPTEVGNSIHDTRTELWAEHLGVPEEMVADPIQGLGQWPGAGNKKGNAVAANVPTTVGPASADKVRTELVQLLEVLRQDPRFIILAPLVFGPLVSAAGTAGSIAAVAAIPDPIGFAKDFLNPSLQC